MPDTLHLEIVTPLASVYSDDVEMVVLPGAEGELGIYPQHIPFITEIKPGELDILKDGERSRFAVGEGFVEITPTQVTVLTDMAVTEESIDAEAVESAIQRAQEALREAEKMTPDEVAATQASLQKSFVQLRLKRKK